MIAERRTYNSNAAWVYRFPCGAHGVIVRGELGAFLGELQGRALVIVDAARVVPDDPCSDDAISP